MDWAGSGHGWLLVLIELVLVRLDIQLLMEQKYHKSVAECTLPNHIIGPSQVSLPYGAHEPT